MTRKFVVMQPNGLYAVYSHIVDTFSEWNLTENEVNKRCLEYFGKSLPEKIEVNCNDNTIYDLSYDIIPVMKLSDAIPHIIANNETTESCQKMLKEMGYKYWNRVVLGSGDTPEDVQALLKRVNIDIAKILYHNNISLEVKDGHILIIDKIYGESESKKYHRFPPTPLEPDFESAKKENYYYTE